MSVANSHPGDGGLSAGASGRTLTLLDLVALGINSVIGSGIYFLPRQLAADMGPAGLLCVIAAGGGCLLILLCFAEASTRFDRTGGAYLYVKSAFGPFVGFEVGWLSWLTRVFTWAALANAFSRSVGTFFPPHVNTYLNPFLVGGVVAGLTAVNVRSARLAARLSNLSMVIKLLPLILFVAVGALFVSFENLTPFAPHGYGSFAETTVVFVFAYLGFESLVIPAGESRGPVRGMPSALLTVMAVVSVTYAAVVFVALATFKDCGASRTPILDAARYFAGDVAGQVIAIGMVVSVFGVNAALAFTTPRSLSALAEERQLPAWLASMHREYRTPWVAALVSGGLTLPIALSGTFEQLAIVSTIARFFQYIPTCMSVLAFRHRERGATAGQGLFRLPFGPVLPLAAVVFCLWLAAKTKFDHVAVGLVVVAVGALVYFLRKAPGRLLPATRSAGSTSCD